jgi:hypothetical protein
LHRFILLLVLKIILINYDWDKAICAGMRSHYLKAAFSSIIAGAADDYSINIMVMVMVREMVRGKSLP